jgi:hypothetical protein
MIGWPGPDAGRLPRPAQGHCPDRPCTTRSLARIRPPKAVARSLRRLLAHFFNSLLDNGAESRLRCLMLGFYIKYSETNW